MASDLRPIGTLFTETQYPRGNGTDGRPRRFTYRVEAHDAVTLGLQPDAPAVLVETVRCVGVEILPLPLRWAVADDGTIVPVESD